MGGVSASGSIEIAAPVDRVFREVTDPRRAPEWNLGIVEIRDVVYPIAPGATWTQLMSIAGRMMTLHCRIVEYEPPFWGELEVAGDQQGTIVTRCHDLGGSTLLAQEATFEPPRGPLGKVARGIMKSMLRREIAQTLARQRDAIERESGAIRE